MFISVLISSVDRAPSLKRTLESLLVPRNLQHDDWEVIVVTDRAGQGQTIALCEEFAERFRGRFYLLTQPGRVKSNAMNLAIGEARGDVLAMTDDDVVCAPEYLEGIRAVFSEAEIAGAQGRIFLQCEGGLPEWMGEDLERFMSLRDYGDQQREWNNNLAGTSMALRAEVFDRVGGYTPELGAGSRLGFCEDSELSVRVRNAGFRLVYAPQIVVYHQLTRGRLTKAFFRKRFFAFGRSQAFYEPLPAPLFSFGAYTAKNVLGKYLLAAWRTMQGRKSEALSLQTDARTAAGFWYQHWRFKRGDSSHLSRVRIQRSVAASGAVTGREDPR